MSTAETCLMSVTAQRSCALGVIFFSSAETFLMSLTAQIFCML